MKLQYIRIYEGEIKYETMKERKESWRRWEWNPRP
jgi:hypothetical protein